MTAAQGLMLSHEVHFRLRAQTNVLHATSVSAMIWQECALMRASRECRQAEAAGIASTDTTTYTNTTHNTNRHPMAEYGSRQVQGFRVA